MTKIHFHSNCMGYGLAWFLQRSPSANRFTIDYVQNFQIMIGEESREREKQVVETADILFYHATKRVLPWPETCQPKPSCQLIPLSVFYQGAYFTIENCHKHIWEPVIQCAREHGVDGAVYHFCNEMDIGYQKIWDEDFAHMQNKEIEEGVPEDQRMSDWQHKGKEMQLLTTKNHPASIVFFHWANRLLKSLGYGLLGEEMERQCLYNNNLVNLPCEDWVTTAARKHLGMSWGASDYMNQRSAAFAKEKLLEWLR